MVLLLDAKLDAFVASRLSLPGVQFLHRPVRNHTGTWRSLLSDRSARNRRTKRRSDPKCVPIATQSISMALSAGPGVLKVSRASSNSKSLTARVFVLRNR